MGGCAVRLVDDVTRAPQVGRCEGLPRIPPCATTGAVARVLAPGGQVVEQKVQVDEAGVRPPGGHCPAHAVIVERRVQAKPAGQVIARAHVEKQFAYSANSLLYPPAGSTICLT